MATLKPDKPDWRESDDYLELRDKVATADGAASMTDAERGRWNAMAWLGMTDEELIRCSGSLGLPAELHPEGDNDEWGAKAATRGQLAELRAAADKIAQQHATAKFVKDWVKLHREEG